LVICLPAARDLAGALAIVSAADKTSPKRSRRRHALSHQPLQRVLPAGGGRERHRLPAVARQTGSRAASGRSGAGRLIVIPARPAAGTRRTGRRWPDMSNVVAFEPYRLRKRRQRIAAACRDAVAHTGMLVIQDAAGQILTFTGDFRFFEESFENARDGYATRIPYDIIRRVRVPSHEHFNGRPNSG